MTGYDYQGAIKAGADPTDVANYMASQTGYDAKSALSAGANVNDVISHMATLGSTPAENPENGPTGFKGILDGVFQDFARPLVTLGTAASRATGNALESISTDTSGMPKISNFFQQASNKFSDLADHNINVGAEDPFGGTIKPFGGAEDAIGGGLKLISYGTMNPVSFGLLQGGGKTFEDFSKGKDWTTSLEEGGITGLTSGLLLKGLGLGGKLLSWGGGQILSDPAAQVLMAGASDFMKSVARRVPGVLDKGTSSVKDLLGGIGQTAYKALGKDFDEGMTSLTQQLGQKLQKPIADATKVLQGLQQQSRDALEAAYKPISDAFTDLYKAPSNISEFPKVNTALQAGDEYLTSIGNKNAVGGAAATNPEVLNALGTQEAPNLANYMAKIKSYMGENPNMTLGQIIHLAQSAPQGLTNGENQAIGDISQNLFRDARDYLEKNNPSMLSQWESFTKQWQDVKQNYDINFADQFKTAAKVGNFVDGLLSGGKKATPEQLQNLMEGFGEQDKQHLSQLVFNEVLQRSTQGVDREAGAKMIDNVIEKYGELLDPRHTTMLQNMSDFMKGDLESTLTNLREAAGAAEEGTAKTMDTVAKQAETLKNIDSTGIMKKVADGDMQGALDSITKVKNPEQMKAVMGLFDDTQKAQLRSHVLSNLLEDTSLLGETKPGEFNPDNLNKALTKILDMDAKTAHELFDPKTISELLKAKASLEGLETLGKAGIKGRLLTTTSALIHLLQGNLPLAGVQGYKAASGSAEEKTASALVSEMLKSGQLKGGTLSKLLFGASKAVNKSAPTVVNAAVSAVEGQQQ